MKNNILTHKIITILSIFILCFFSICVTNVHAADIPTAEEYNTLPSAVSNAVHSLYEYGNFDYSIYVFQPSYSSSYRAVIIDNTVHTDFVVWYNSSHIQIEFFDFMFYDITIDGVVGERQVVTPGAYNNYGENYTNSGFLFSNITVQNNITGETTFFPRPPTVTKVLVEETTRTQIMEQMRITIVGFLKSLLLLVISVIAFWKAWAFLKKNLKKA